MARDFGDVIVYGYGCCGVDDCENRDGIYDDKYDIMTFSDIEGI